MSDTPARDPAKLSNASVVSIAARAYERDRYLTALLAPAPLRDDLIALAAFAGEIGRIPGYVSEPMLGEIRMQWWRDQLDRAAEPAARAAEPAGHPIADALARAQRTHALPLELLHSIIDGHSARLSDAPFADLAALEANLDAIDGALFSLSAHILAGPASDASSAVIRQAGQAYGLARILIEAPATFGEGRNLLPVDMVRDHPICVSAELDQTTATRNVAVIQSELAGIARAAVGGVRSHWRALKPPVRVALLPVALVTPYLRASEKQGVSALETRDIAPLTRVWRLWLAHRTGRSRFDAD